MIPIALKYGKVVKPLDHPKFSVCRLRVFNAVDDTQMYWKARDPLFKFGVVEASPRPCLDTVLAIFDQYHDAYVFLARVIERNEPYFKAYRLIH